MQADNMITQLNESLNRFEGLLNRLEGYNPSLDHFQTVEYEKALKDAVCVLDATKNSFKSKQLKELRERLEAVLESKQK